MAYAELAALRPRAGGEYVYLREAYGPLAGFLTGWTSFVAGFAGAMAASAVFLVFYLDRFIPGRRQLDAVLRDSASVRAASRSRGRRSSRSPRLGSSPSCTFAASGPGRLTSNVLTTLKVAALLIFIAVGLTMGAGSSGEPAAVGRPGHGDGLSLGARSPVMFTYSGWNAAAYMAEEVRDPGRNLPLALALGTAAVIVIYLLINVLYLYVMPIGELAQ